jgi:hypothetical protein
MVEAQQLLILAELDARSVAVEAGMPDTAAWVAGMSRVRGGTARRMVDAARRMADAPEVSAVAVSGRLSFEQLAPALRAAVTAADDAFWAREAPGRNPSSLDHAARVAARLHVDPDEDLEQRRRTFVRYRHDAPAGMVRGTFALPDVDGETLLRALEREVESEPPAGEEHLDGYETRAARALVRLAAQRVVDDLDADRATVVVHATVETLAGSSDAPAEIDVSGIMLLPETARFLACDCRLELVAELRNGLPVSFARTQRTVPPKLARSLRRRDRHCRFPGCARTKRLHAHHIQFWMHGGRTVSTNLVMLCPFHHRLVHEQHWTISGNPDRADGLELRSATGRPPPGPPTVPARRVTDWFALAT